MAATTTQPYLWSVRAQKDPTDVTRAIITTTWRARSLTTGELLEVHVTNTQLLSDSMTKDTWDQIYGDFSDEWTAVTADTTHTATPFTDYPVSL